MLNGIRNKIKRVTAMGCGLELTHQTLGGAPWINMPGSIWIDLPKEAVDDVCTVIKVEFDEPLDAIPVDNHADSKGGN